MLLFLLLNPGSQHLPAPDSSTEIQSAWTPICLTLAFYQNQAAHVIKRLMHHILYWLYFQYSLQNVSSQMWCHLSLITMLKGMRMIFTKNWGSERPEQVPSLKVFIFLIYLFVCVWDTCVLWFLFACLFLLLFLSPGNSNRQPSLKYQPITILPEPRSRSELLGGPCLACKALVPPRESNLVGLSWGTWNLHFNRAV